MQEVGVDVVAGDVFAACKSVEGSSLFQVGLSSFVDAGCQGWVASRPAPQAPGAEERKRRGSLVAVLTAHRSPPLTV